jgi:Clostripain family
MVYLAGDNNLADEMVYALKCMQLVGSAPRVDGTRQCEIFALYDGGVGPATLRIGERANRPEGVQLPEGFLGKIETRRRAEAQDNVRNAAREQDRARREVDRFSNPQEVATLLVEENPVFDGLPNPLQLVTDLRGNNQELGQLVANGNPGDQLLTNYLNNDVQEKRNVAQAQLRRAREHRDQVNRAARRAPQELPEVVDSVQMALTKFVVETIRHHPAEHYLLVLSGHGSGAVGDFLTGNKRFVGLSIPELREALTVVQEEFQRQIFEEDERSFLNDGKIDILGLDSCVMGMVEVAYEVRECVKFLVGAEAFEPNTGWPYDRILSLLRQGSTPRPRRFAKQIAQEYIEYYSSDYTVADVSTDVCVLDLGHIEKLATALGRNLMQAPRRDFHSARTIRTAIRNILHRYGNNQRLLELLNDALAALRDDPDVRTGFEGFDELFDYFRELLNGNEIRDEITEALGGGIGFQSLLNQTLQGSAIRDIKADARRWHEGLATVLRTALEDRAIRAAVKDALVLAHWEAQGYKFEQHVDLWDFCDRLSNRCDQIGKSQTRPNSNSRRIALRIAKTRKKVREGCTEVKRAIRKLVLHSAYCGPAFQHSHGISIFFPWANITDASGFAEMEHYKSLEFAHKTQWDEFVSAYHQATQRDPRRGPPPNHPSTLNRRDGLFTTRPAAFGTPLSVKLGTKLTDPIAGRLVRAFGTRLGTSLNARLGTSLNARLGTSLNARLGTSLNARLGTSLNARLGTSLNARLGTSLNARLGTSLNARLGTSLNARLGTSLNARLGTSLNARFGTGGGEMPKIESMKNPPVKWRNQR